jgi:hypothetical protein
VERSSTARGCEAASRLREGDVLAVGATLIEFCMPTTRSTAPPTPAACAALPPVRPTPGQLRVLEALCLSVETIKGTLSALFELFALEALPQNQKRATLAARALALL